MTTGTDTALASASTADSTTELAIRTTGLRKVFRKQRAVDGIDLAVPRGSVFGFLGPNGSGKTTTIRMLLGLSSATSGSIDVLGEPMPRGLHSVLPRVGALVEGPAFYPYLSGRANLSRFDAADPTSDPRTRKDRVAHALDRVGLTHAADKKAHAYSLGMKQRLGLANALLSPRELLVLDEPTNGLDPQGTREVRHLIRSLADDGTTVFVSSHLLAEIEQVCTHAAVMRTGSLVAQGPLDELRAAGARTVTVRTPDVGQGAVVLTRLGLEPRRDGGSDVLVADLTADVAPETITAELVRADVRVRGLAVGGGTLEDLFVALTGEGFDVAG
ncbi:MULTISPECIES: ABC transporter ATP-binding protein [unclassified Curtobacterium]|uniref:ABC transporter ATP-binding protein n=1 Tax=unclassified Curtobacterium TaxID=257496 RepID=UPI000DA751D7|nr:MULTISPECIES: ATP-binding cassette domain-containing protein [unclassified Curtobacterium]PZE63883.1 ABC transporter ATP-binding protein [Curtobacterium sp. MCBD17_021]WIB25641.1 ATP-binding cassette domain-containing protein [Curtobacterium sp. MCSS17_015]